MTRRIKRKAWWGVGAVGASVCLLVFSLPFFLRTTYSAGVSPKDNVAGVSLAASSTPVSGVTHVSTPSPVKAIYMTACVAGTPSWRAQLETLINTTELNSVVIDIKDYSGTISFIDPSLPQVNVKGCQVSDMQAFIAELHKNNIYVIGRITVFQDPYYTAAHPELAIKSISTGGLWKDTHGLSYIDVGAKPYWDYIVTMAKDSYNIGFDEINFDYVRYPSDGDLKDMDTSWTVGSSTKADEVRDFFSYLHDNLKGTGVKTSADLFGLTTLAHDDMGIGQVLENALPYFDYVDPMVYPSHFADGTDGYKNPNAEPYQIIQYSMSSAVAREQALDVKEGIATSTPSKLRPWLQDFTLGDPPYGVAQVQAQIKATYDVGLSSWLMWNAGDKYTDEAFAPK